MGEVQGKAFPQICQRHHFPLADSVELRIPCRSVSASVGMYLFKWGYVEEPPLPHCMYYVCITRALSSLASKYDDSRW